MTLYQKIVAKGGVYHLRITLDQLGAITKPHFVLKVEHGREGLYLPKQPMNYFVEQLPDATEAIDATVALSNRLERMAVMHDFDKVLSLAQMLHGECRREENWPKLKSILLDNTD